jgi:hypothetical protein
VETDSQIQVDFPRPVVDLTENNQPRSNDPPSINQTPAELERVQVEIPSIISQRDLNFGMTLQDENHLDHGRKDWTTGLMLCSFLSFLWQCADQWLYLYF